MNDGLVLVALKALCNETKALIISNELGARRMPAFQLRAVFNAMVQSEDERRFIVDLVDKDLQASGFSEDQVYALLNDLMTAPNALQLNEGVQSTRRLRSPFTQNFESQNPVHIGTGIEGPNNAYGARPAFAQLGNPAQPEARQGPTGQFNRQAQPGIPGMPGQPAPEPEQNYQSPQRTGSFAPLGAPPLSVRPPMAGMPPPPPSFNRTATQTIPRGEAMQPGPGAGTGTIPPPPLAASQRYSQNHFREADAAVVAAQTLPKPVGFTKNSYSAPGEGGATLPMRGQGMNAPGFPSQNYGNEQSAAATAQSISEAALLTPGLANLNAQLTSRVVSRTEGSPNNFQSGQPLSSRRPNDGRPTILIADDDKRIRMVFRLRMEESGLTVVECSDGSEAWERIQQGDISLAVLDMKMPGLHGLEVLSRMADKQFKIPVIVCSAYDQLKDEFVVQTYPKLRYLVKPVAPEQLVGSIKELLAKSA